MKDNKTENGKVTTVISLAKECAKIRYIKDGISNELRKYELYIVGKDGVRTFSHDNPPEAGFMFAKRKHKIWLCNIQQVLGDGYTAAMLLYADDLSGTTADNGIIIKISPEGERSVFEWKSVGVAGKMIYKSLKAVITTMLPNIAEEKLSIEDSKNIVENDNVIPTREENADAVVAEEE